MCQAPEKILTKKWGGGEQEVKGERGKSPGCKDPLGDTGQNELCSGGMAGVAQDRDTFGILNWGSTADKILAGAVTLSSIPTP